MKNIKNLKPTAEEINTYDYYRDRMNGLLLQKHGNFYNVLGVDAQRVVSICEDVIIHKDIKVGKTKKISFVSISEETLSKNIGLLINERVKVAII